MGRPLHRLESRLAGVVFMRWVPHPASSRRVSVPPAESSTSPSCYLTPVLGGSRSADSVEVMADGKDASPRKSGGACVGTPSS